MQKKNGFIEKCKKEGRNAFMNIGHSAVGNNGEHRGNTPILPFSFLTWSYEKPMPKRKNK